MTGRDYCIACGAITPYRVESELQELTVRGVRFRAKEYRAVCEQCGDEIYVPEINDANADARAVAYFAATDITYCSCAGCPLRSCDRHPRKIPRDGTRVSVADFAPTCREYIAYVVRRKNE